MTLEQFWHGFLKRPYRLKKIVDVGTGPINIVLIHGLASRSEIWTPLINILDSKKYHIRSYDLLGFGVSPKPQAAKYSTKEHARSIMHSLMKDSRKNDQFIFVGHSMGCIITAYIAYRWPHKVRGSILYKPPLLLDPSERRSMHKKFYEYIATKPSTFVIYLKLMNRFTDRLEGFKLDEENWSPIKNSLSNTILAQETLKHLRETKKPIEIIYGRFDLLASKVKAKKLAEINPSLRLHYVTEMHDIRPKSSKYITRIIEGL